MAEGTVVLQYFGGRWDAPMLDPTPGVEIVEVPTPAGQGCFNCNLPIVPGDRGLIRIVGRAHGASEEPTHVECDLLGIIGHDLGVCPCKGFDYSDYRAAALEVLKRLNAERARHGHGPLWTEPEPELITIAREDIQILFDLAVNSLDFGSGFWDVDDVRAARRIAQAIGVDPDKATPSGWAKHMVVESETLPDGDG